MSSIEKGFSPLPKVEREQPEDKIKILLNLPDYVDQDRIGVNLRDISKLCKLGGISQLIVVGKTDQDTSHVVPEVTGLNSDGSATVSKKIAKVTVPTFESSVDNSAWHDKWISDRWINLEVNLNIDEIALRVSEKPEGVHGIKNWSQELNKGFKTPIRESGSKNLLQGLETKDKDDLIELAGFVFVFDLFSALRGAHISPGYVAQSFLFANLGRKICDVIYKRGNPDYRFSIFPGPQIDRAIALGILSRTKTLVKDLHTEKQ